MPLSSDQVILYAADPVDFAVALAAAAAAGIAPTQVYGNFESAWTFADAGGYLVIAVGGPANNALYWNHCGWANPAHDPADQTPFAYVTNAPLDTLPPKDEYENAAGASRSDSLTLAVAYTYYAVHGALPSLFSTLPAPATAMQSCSGSSDVGCVCKTYWGVDTAAAATSTVLSCLLSNVGSPVFWGRYVNPLSGIGQAGLSSGEIYFLHSNGIRILLIWDYLADTTWHSAGVAAADDAANRAAGFGVPDGKAIFVDIEAGKVIGSGYVEGWCDRLQSRGYVPGFYMNPGAHQTFAAPFCAALNADPTVRGALLWSDEPDMGPSKEGSAPAWAPYSPSCAGQVYAWQYGQGSSSLCNVDTDLCHGSLLPYLW